MNVCPHIGRRFAQADGWRCSNCGTVMPFTADDPAPAVVGGASPAPLATAVSGDERDKAIGMARSIWHTATLSATQVSEATVDALIAAGWGPVSGVVRPTREALMAAMEGHGATRDETPTLADALLAAGHLWTEQPSDDPRKVAHIECDCVPDLGPSHCHLCSDRAGHPMSWMDAHPSVPVVDREALAQALWRADAAWVPGGQSDEDPKRKAFFLDRAGALIVSGALTDRAVVEAEQREKDAQTAEATICESLTSPADARAASIAAAIRDGGAS